MHQDATVNPHATHPARLVFIGIYILCVLAAGVFLRNWTWHATAAIHFPDDISNGLFWGEQTVLEGRRLSPGASGDTWSGFFNGYISIYDSSKASGQIYVLDYTPLRLLIMSVWAKQAGMPPLERSAAVFKYAEPLLLLNLLCELASAVAVFLLVRTWLERSAASTRPGWFRKLSPNGYILICSLAAATVAWLEPTMILDAHAWPQWDVWIMPFYLFAALSMLNNRWLLCGCLIAIGAMIKPQILIVAPFFVFVPLWGGQWRRMLHLLAGFGIASGLVVLPWLVHGEIAWGFIVEAALTCAAICVVRRKVALEGGAWMGIRNLKPREAVFWCSLVFAAAIFLAGWLCGGDFAWLRAGFQRTSETSPQLAEPAVWGNLPALLARSGWKLDDKLQATITLRLALRIAYLCALALCAFGAARHPRLLISLAVPWLLMFALMGQMHSRYLLWGAVASAVSLGVSWRLSILHFILSAAGAAMILSRLNEGKNFAPLRPALDLINQIKPWAAYAVLASVAVYFWFSFWRSRPAWAA